MKSCHHDQTTQISVLNQDFSRLHLKMFFLQVTITAKQGVWMLKVCCGWAEDEGPA